MINYPARQEQIYQILNFVAIWTVITIAGWLAWILAVAPPIGFILFPLAAFCGFVPGVTVGLFQWLLLRRRLKNASLWLAASAIGSVIGWAYILYRSGSAGGTGNAENGIIIGLIIGICQAIFLVRTQRWRVVLWICVSVIGWTIGWAIYGPAITHQFDLNQLLNNVAIAGLVSGLVTGFPLALLLI